MKLLSRTDNFRYYGIDDKRFRNNLYEVESVLSDVEFWDKSPESYLCERTMTFSNDLFYKLEIKSFLVDENYWRKQGVLCKDVLGVYEYNESTNRFERQFVGEDISFKYFLREDDAGISGDTLIFVCCLPNTIVGEDVIDFTSMMESFKDYRYRTDTLSTSITALLECQTVIEKYVDELRKSNERFECLKQAVENLSLLPGMSEYNDAKENFEHVASLV